MTVAVVTGGSRGIGRAIVENFAAAGYAVAFTYLSNQDLAESLVCSLRNEGKSLWRRRWQEHDEREGHYNQTAFHT